jgi:hypothetical protein
MEELHNAELRNVPISLYDGVNKSRRWRWIEHVGCIKEKKCVEVEDGRPYNVTLLREVGMDSKAQIKWILKKSVVNIWSVS